MKLSSANMDKEIKEQITILKNLKDLNILNIPTINRLIMSD